MLRLGSLSALPLAVTSDRRRRRHPAGSTADAFGACAPAPIILASLKRRTRSSRGLRSGDVAPLKTSEAASRESAGLIEDRDMSVTVWRNNFGPPIVRLTNDS